jgi:hypothetical protein
MKYIFKLILLSSSLAVLLSGCKKDEHKDYFKGGTKPVLTASISGASLPLSFQNRNSEAIKLTWTNPNYQFTTGISSQDVSYLIEIDTTGSNFTSPKRQSIAVSKDLSRSFTQGEFNGYLLNQLILDTGVSHNIEFRVTSYLTNNSVKLSSNVLKYAVMPYSIPPAVTPPASGELYITGNAVASDWTNTPPASQKFTKITSTLYEIIIPLVGGNSYTFLPTYASWNDKYSIAVKNDPNEVNGGDFQWQGNDILAPAASGTYKISIDFQRGKFTVTKQ